MHQPPGFKDEQFPNRVCKLKKGLYGLKQGARVWNLKLKKTLLELGFRQSDEDECLFMKDTKEGPIYILIHVDDMLLIGSSTSVLVLLKDELEKRFAMTRLGEVSQYLGIQIVRAKDGHFIMIQSAYIKSLLQRFGLQEAKVSNIPLDTGYLTSDDESDLLKDNETY